MEGEHISTTSSAEVNLVEDRLSLLPAQIQHHIMSFLRTHEALKTTLLSRMWRTMWLSVPILRFDYHAFPDVDDKLNCFLQFIRHTIAHHDASSLKTFGLYLWPPGECDAPIENEWLAFAVQHNVQNIALRGKLEIRPEMPECLFTCRSIVTMELSIKNVIFKWPETALLPNLRKLSLVDMALSVNLGAHLSSVCPQLETLLVLMCNLRALEVFSITSPRLKILKIYRCLGIGNCVVKLATPCLEQFSYIAGIALDYDITHLDSLSVGDVTFLGSSRERRRDDCCLSAMKLAIGISSARRLTVNEFFIKYLSNGSGLLGLILFHQLEMASLTLWPTREQVLTTFLFLSRCPKLSILNIAIAGPREPSSNIAKLQFADMLSQLSSVQITEFEGSENEMELVRIFLLNSPSLREMNIGVASEDDDSGSDADSDSDSDNLRMTVVDIKSKILQMQDLARSSCINISFS